MFGEYVLNYQVCCWYCGNTPVYLTTTYKHVLIYCPKCKSFYQLRKR